MDSFTVPPELEGTKGDIVAARIEVPILAAMTYGIVEFIRLGWSQDHYLYTYGPVLGGVSASIGLFTYFFFISAERKRSRKSLMVLFGCLPYFYSLYIMGVLGLYTIFEGVIGTFSIWSMIVGIFWVFVGFHLIYRFYLMTEIVRQHDEKTKVARASKID
jgi:Ca2+/Na+ antiporter